jgi:hypothetical protein
MNFNELMQRMRELDQPVDAQPQSLAVEECGDMPPMAPPMHSTMNSKPDTPPPSMSLNLNAQGMDNIESLMKLMTKVNPDMINQPQGGMPALPSLTPPGPSIMSIKSELPPLKMLPLDMDDKGPDMDDKGPDMDDKGPDMDDMDDNGPDMDDMDDKKKDEWANSPDGASGPGVKGMDAAVPNGDDLNRSKGTYPKVAGGDNPMQKDAFRESIRAELQKRLNEAKGVK